MPSGGGGGEKTEKATPKKRRDERKKGNVMVSKDVVAVATLLTTYAILKYTLPSIAQAAGALIKFCVNLVGSVPTGGASDVGAELTSWCSMTLARTVTLPLLATALAAIVATFAQTKFLVSGEALRPKFSRLNPLNGIKNLFSLKSLIEVVKGTLKITILIILIVLFIRDSLTSFIHYMDTDINAACVSLMTNGMELMKRVCMAFVVIAFFDFLYQWWQFERDMKMSKQEIKEEYKQMEGDPQVKGKIKQLQRKMSQQRMMQAVPESDVVIRNPTHFAVALRYKAEKDRAPVVLAKGQDNVALRIVAIAEEHHIAVVEDKPLARALFDAVEPGDMIPVEFYTAVADVLVYIYKLDKKK